MVSVDRLIYCLIGLSVHGFDCIQLVWCGYTLASVGRLMCWLVGLIMLGLDWIQLGWCR